MHKRTILLSVAALVSATAVGAPTPGAAATPTCFDRAVTIMGTPGNDVLVGQSGVADVIYGGGGDDFISGGDFYSEDNVPGAAPDYICGGPGRDIVNGGPGNDHINGGGGNDRVRGYLGIDVEQGNAGNDTVGSGSFADLDVRPDVLKGNDGADLILGDWGHDRLEGGSGPDRIVDEECDRTVIHGGGGDDSVESFHSSFEDTDCSEFGDNEGDAITGDAGDDTVHGSPADTIKTAEHVTRS